MEDAELVVGLRAGRAEAFDAAYALYGDRIHSFLARLAGRRDLADDLHQETFLQLARHAMRLAEDTDLKAWLYTVARNRFRSYWRWALLDRDRIREMGPGGAIDERTPHDDLAARVTREQLEAALAELPMAQREVLLLVAVEGLGQDQVAEVLGVAHDAVRQRLTRARAHLAERLAVDERRVKR